MESKRVFFVAQMAIWDVEPGVLDSERIPLWREFLLTWYPDSNLKPSGTKNNQFCRISFDPKWPMSWKIQPIQFKGQPSQKRGQLGSRYVIYQIMIFLIIVEQWKKNLKSWPSMWKLFHKSWNKKKSEPLSSTRMTHGWVGLQFRSQGSFSRIGSSQGHRSDFLEWTGGGKGALWRSRNGFDGCFLAIFWAYVTPWIEHYDIINLSGFALPNI